MGSTGLYTVIYARIPALDAELINRRGKNWFRGGRGANGHTRIRRVLNLKRETGRAAGQNASNCVLSRRTNSLTAEPCENPSFNIESTIDHGRVSRALAFASFSLFHSSSL